MGVLKCGLAGGGTGPSIGKKEQGQHGGEGMGLDGQEAPVQPTPVAGQLLQRNQLSAGLTPTVIPIKPTVLHLGLTWLNNTRVTF